jgi:hypothetical protein
MGNQTVTYNIYLTGGQKPQQMGNSEQTHAIKNAAICWKERTSGTKLFWNIKPN